MLILACNQNLILQPRCTTCSGNNHHNDLVEVQNADQTLDHAHFQATLDCVQEHVEAGLGGRPEVGVRGLLQLADEEPQAHLTVETQEAARLAFNPAQEFKESMLTFRSNLFSTCISHFIPLGLMGCWGM